jgi:hypothetical protein
VSKAVLLLLLLLQSHTRIYHTPYFLASTYTYTCVVMLAAANQNKQRMHADAQHMWMRSLCTHQHSKL